MEFQHCNSGSVLPTRLVSITVITHEDFKIPDFSTCTFGPVRGDGLQPYRGDAHCLWDKTTPSSSLVGRLGGQVPFAPRWPKAYYAQLGDLTED